jgi:NADH-quinone oxidoreductase subunit L
MIASVASAVTVASAAAASAASTSAVASASAAAASASPSLTYLWAIPALPLLAAAIAAATPQAFRRVASGAALAAMGVAAALSWMALGAATALPSQHLSENFVWLSTGAFSVKLGVVLDPLCAFMLVMVTFVSFLIFLFSTAYMRDDERYAKFFCFLSLFGAAMLGIIVSNSLLLTFICWELVGLASYLLIGFWFTKPAAAAAAKKAFITTRVGDIGFLLGLLWLHHAAGTQLFYDNGAGALEAVALGKLGVLLPGGMLIATAIGLLLFAGAVGKSGQFPLHVWLPDAMEGPTPVSALIHAATMVAAGVFLMARVWPLLALSQTAQTVIAFIGAATALLGAVVALAQNDIKRVLAFSTVSQLGYMMLAVGVGAPAAAMFHLLTHAFFKALLFLGAGSVIHAAHHEQDMRKMGGLAPRMKLTFATFATGMMALSGVPFLFSGFWSKEAVLHSAEHWSVSHLPLAIGLVAVVLTAFYMTRLMANVFFGNPRSHAAKHAVENEWPMTFPLALLAVCAVFVGFFGTPAWPWLQAKLDGAATAAFAPAELFNGAGLMVLSIVLVALGIGAGWAIYGRQTRTSADAPDPLQVRAPRLWRALENRLWFDELYEATVLRLHAACGAAADIFDRFVVDGAVRLTAKTAAVLGLVNRDICEHGINASLDASADGLRTGGASYLREQTGDAHDSLRGIALGFVVLVLCGVILCALF